MAFGQVMDGGRMSKWYNGKGLSQMTTEISIHSRFWFILNLTQAICLQSYKGLEVAKEVKRSKE